jgi:hypothetical protein
MYQITLVSYIPSHHTNPLLTTNSHQDLYIAFQLTIPFHPRQYQCQSVEYRLSGAYCYPHFD